MSSRIAEPLAVLATVLSVSGAFAQPPGTLAPATQNTPQSVVKYWLEPAPTAAGVLERGRWLFRQKGCFLCHGPEGQGGVSNRNYIKDTIPRLALAEQMKLFEPEDVSAILEQMKRGVRLDTLADSPPAPQFNVVLAQYHSIQDVIRKGNPAGKKDPKRPAPPLNMPGWGRELSDADIDALIAYLLSAVPREEPRGMAGTPGGYVGEPGNSESKSSSCSLR
jgi:mono/diheme cytochrome c family protein